MRTKSENLIFLLTIWVHLWRVRPNLARGPAGEELIFIEWPVQGQAGCGTACAQGVWDPFLWVLA